MWYNIKLVIYMNKKELFKSLIIFTIIILLGVIDYHVSCVYLDYLEIPRNLKLSIKSSGLCIDLTLLLLMIELVIIYKIYDYKKNRIVLIYPQI